MRFGFHVSFSGGWQKVIERAVERRCTALQVFTSSPVQWARDGLAPGQCAWFRDALRELDIQPLFVHAIYLLNLATGDAKLWRKSRANLREEVARAEMIGAAGVVLHLGSVGQRGRPEAGLRRVSKALDWALERSSGNVPVLLENSAGQGNSVGGSAAETAAIIEGCNHRHKLGVCVDTSHALAHGYPLHTEQGIREFLDVCDAAFGLQRIALVHANDSETALGSRVDRHEHIGKGHIGTAGFRAIMNEPRLRDLPFIMETHDQEHWHKRDMTALRRCVEPDIRPALPKLKAILPLLPPASAAGPA